MRIDVIDFPSIRQSLDSYDRAAWSYMLTGLLLIIDAYLISSLDLEMIWLIRLSPLNLY